MLLVHVPKITNRIGYTLNLIFKDILKIDFTITLNPQEFIDFEEPKINYGKEALPGGIFIKSCPLLFSSTIEIQDLNETGTGLDFTIFPVYNKEAAFSFDIFAASFYLVSRYEEYLPHKTDEFCRFASKESLAVMHEFIEIPLVNHWAEKIKSCLSKKYPDISFENEHRKFKFVPTFNINSAYSFKHKGFFRNAFGFFSSIFSGDFKKATFRIHVLLGKEQDPSDSFDFIIQGIKENRLKALFFILFAKYGEYDKNISVNSVRFHRLIKHLADYAKIGIQPSFLSFDEPSALKKEIHALEKVLHKPIKRNRQYFNRIRLPETYQQLIENNIEEDYSMGYTNLCGFRASICTPFSFYDLALGSETKLRLFPFAVTDHSLRLHMGKTPDEAIQYSRKMMDEVKKYKGKFICVFHNDSLSNTDEWKGWQKVYTEMLSYGKSLMRKEL